MCKEYSTAKWLFVGASFWCSATSAGVWTVAPGLELQETYTDNVELSAPGLEKSEYITSIVPTLGVIGQGGDFEFSLDYRLERLLYSDNAEFDNTYHQLQSMFKSELVDEAFFIEMDGRVAQQIIDPQGAVAESNVFVTENRTNVVSFSVSPYFNTRHSDGSQILIRPTFGWNKYEDLENIDNKISRYEFLYQQNRPENNHGWLFRINSTRVDYDNGNKTELGLVNLEGRVRIYRRLNLVAGIGYEDNEYDQVDGEQSIDGSNWTLGLSWRPSRRTSIEMRVGERFFGSTGSFSLNRRGRNSQWNIFYEESVDAGGQATTLINSNEESVDAEGPATTSTNSVLDSGIVPDPEVSIVERLSIDYSYDLSKIRTSFNFSKLDRALQLSGTTEESLSAQISFLLRWSSRTSAEYRYTINNNKYSITNREDKGSTVSLSLNHRHGRIVSSSLLFQREARESDLVSDSYTGNMARVTVTAAF